MNKTKAGISLTLLFFVFSGFAGVAHAATCTPPTPPVCYQNVPLYSNTGFQSDGAIVSSDGQTVVLPNGYGNAVPNSKQVQTSCGNTDTTEIQYQADMLTYNTCQSAGSNPPNLSDLIGQDAAKQLKCESLGTWFDYDKVTQTCVDHKVQELSLVCTYASMYGPNSYYDPNKDGCVCKSGYALTYNPSTASSRCILPPPVATSTTPTLLPPATTTMQAMTSAPPSKAGGTVAHTVKPKVISITKIVTPTTTTTTTEVSPPAAQLQKALTTEAAAPPMKHWYEWLNPINWFSWLH